MFEVNIKDTKKTSNDVVLMTLLLTFTFLEILEKYL